MTVAIVDKASSQADAARLKVYRRIVVLTDGFSTPYYAKTGCSLLRYRAGDVAAVFETREAGQTAQTLLSVGGDVPVVGTLDGLEADALFLGIATPGGKLPSHWRAIILDALKRGLDVVSGLHHFLNDDAEFTQFAQQHGCRLIDIRRNEERETATGAGFRKGCLRVLTVGHDCSVGKMVASLEVQRELARRDIDARFVATGQTGIMITGEGVPVDCVVSDFVNGSVEALVKRNQHHEVLMIEGQGSIAHPSFSAVTMGLLHGCAPDGLIFCYEVGRTNVKGLMDVPLLSNRTLIEVYEDNASLRHTCRVIGIAMNSRNVSLTEATLERKRVHAEFGLPVCDVYRHGATDLADAVLDLQREIK